MSARQVIAVDLGGTKLAAGLVDRDGAVVRRAVEPTDLASEDTVLAQLERVIGALAEGGFAALGVGIPSTIDQRSGRAVTSVNIPLGAARQARHVVMLTLGTGVGGGLILDNRLYRGAVGAAGELGHITLDLNGPACQGACPGRGHLEAMASGLAADRLAERAATEHPEGDLGQAAAGGRDVDPRLLVELAAAGPGDARDVLEHIGFHLGVGISDLVNVFNPEVVVVGGGFAEAGELLLVTARRVVAERALLPAREVAAIVEAELGPDAGLIGAALVAHDALDEG
jgi:glucokinase